MKLLLKRAQTDGGIGKVKFKLWAKTELEEDEQHIVKRYRFDSAKLVVVIQLNLLRNAAFVALGVGIVTFFLLSSIRIPLSPFLALLAGLASGYFFYDRRRESVLVRDLLHGRYFTCDSVVDLARKEAWVSDAVAVFRQVMETAKHWDDTEITPIPVLSKEDAKYITIIRGFD